MSNFGRKVKISLFGESHGEVVGMVLEGIPAGESVQKQMLEAFLQRRAPGRFEWSTPRKEEDIPVFLSGITNGKTNGFPICATIKNTNNNSKDYEEIKNTPRPGHADYTANLRYGGKADMRGGGFFSGRLTAPLCIAGGICLQLLEREGVQVGAHALQIGKVKGVSYLENEMLSVEDLRMVKTADFPASNKETGNEMKEEIKKTQAEGDSVGGVIECAVLGMPAGIGGPYFEGMEGALSNALFAIPGVKGVSFGAGFGVAEMKGSENNDAFVLEGGKAQMQTNNSGGILGGITTGAPLIINVAVKPTPSIAKAQQTVNLVTMKQAEIQIKGRHDPCIIPRAVPVVEAVVGMVLLDLLLLQNEGE